MHASTSHTLSDTDASSDTACDSSSPLLEENKARSKPSPLPKLSLTAVCLARLVDPVNFSQIFPYVNEFMGRLHVTDDPNKIGFYSGLVESAFAFCQLLSIYRWAKLSDAIGRRTVIMLGMIGLAVGTLGIGLSRTLPMVIVFRCLGGLFSGNVAVVHAAVGELSDPSNQNLIFPIYGLFWPLGSIVGPLIGGALANPATKFSFFDTQFWRHYPYFLPCLASAIIVIFSVIFAFFFLEEYRRPSQNYAAVSYKRTLPKQLVGRTLPTAPLDPPLDPPNRQAPPPRAPPFLRPLPAFHQTMMTIHSHKEPAKKEYGVKELLSMTVIRALCASGFALCMIATAFDVVFVLFCYSPVKSGGLGFNPSLIGACLAGSGFVAVLLQLFAMPPLLKRVHAGKLYMICMWVWPIVFLLMPFLNLVARKGDLSFGGGDGVDTTTQNDAGMLALLIIGIAFTLALSRVGSLGYSLSLILVKQYAPDPQALASTNGLVQFAMCIARAIAPAFISSAFAFSIDKNLLGGHLWLVILVIICLGGCWVSRRIPRSKLQEDAVHVGQDGEDDHADPDASDEEIEDGYQGDGEEERERKSPQIQTKH